MKTSLDKAIKEEIKKIPETIISRIKKHVRTKIHSTEFNADKNHFMLEEKDFEWLAAAGTKKHPTSKKSKNK